MKIEHREKYILIFVLLALFLMLLVPPWESSGYGIIFEPPEGASEIDFKRLVLQMALIGIVATALLLATKEKLAPTEATDRAAPQSLVTVIGIFACAAIAVLSFHFYKKSEAEKQAKEIARRQAELENQRAQEIVRIQEASRVQAEQARLQAEELEKANAEAWKARLQSLAKPKQWKLPALRRGSETSVFTYWKNDDVYYRLQLKGSPDTLEIALADKNYLQINMVNSDRISVLSMSVAVQNLKSYRDKFGALSMMCSDAETYPCSIEKYESIVGAQLTEF